MREHNGSQRSEGLPDPYLSEYRKNEDKMRRETCITGDESGNFIPESSGRTKMKKIFSCMLPLLFVVLFIFLMRLWLN